MADASKEKLSLKEIFGVTVCLGVAGLTLASTIAGAYAKDRQLSLVPTANRAIVEKMADLNRCSDLQADLQNACKNVAAVRDHYPLAPSSAPHP